MRIALLHPFSWPEVRRGGERYAHDLAWWLSRAGHDVDYIATAATPSIDTIDGARIVRLGCRDQQRLTTIGVRWRDSFGRVVLPWLSRHRYDVVHAMEPQAAITAAFLRQPVVYTAIGHPGPLDKPARSQDRTTFRRAVRAARVSTALSASAADAATAITGRRPRVLNPGLRSELFSPALAARIGGPRVLFAADSDDPRKRLNVLLDAMPAVLDAFPDARLVLGGGGSLPHSVPDEVRAIVDSPGIGKIDDVADRYRTATLTVLPSINEAFGLVLIESMACGTPVVASNSGGMPEIVDREVGALAAPDDADALARAMIDVVSLAADPATPRRCAEHAKQWDWDVVGPQHLSAYDDAIRK
jgi:phosphatidyl-myo-inositol alpha-mannosyltransferase